MKPGREGVSPGVKWSHKTFSCPHFYSKRLALNLYARWSGCAMTDSQLTHSRFQNPKSLHRISLCGIINVLRYGANFQCLFKVSSEFHVVLWSPLSRCSIQKECALGLLARSWISMGEGPQQCPSMTLTPPEISVSADIKVKSASPHASVTPGIQNKCLFYVVSRISLMRSVAFETLQKFLGTSFAQVKGS